jgi:hypothetical protein
VIVRLLTETEDFLINSDLQGQLESSNDSVPRISLILNRSLSVTTSIQAQPITTAKTPILSRDWKKELSVKNKSLSGQQKFSHS